MNTNERIKLLRTSLNLTQEELGEKLGVQKATIQKYENGSIINFKIDTIKQLANVFNVTPSYLMGWDSFDKKVDLEKLKREIHFIEKIENVFGEIGVRIYEAIHNLNDEGIDRIIEYCEDIKQNPKYIK